MNLNSDTIFALSTPDIASAICVFRLSGSNVYDIAKVLTKKKQFKSGKIYYSHIYDPHTQEKIDSGIVFYKQAPHSFTGEDSLELQLHGSRAVIKKIHTILASLSLCRPAEAGEFTKRAFLNDKIDIFKAEALSDLISAQTDYQRRMAQEGLSGKFSDFITDLRSNIITLNAQTHAMIDFADDEVPFSVDSALKSLIEKDIKSLNLFLKSAYNASDVKKGLKVVIVGQPNVGKSSFINNILGRDAVIVSEIAGTTRDILEFTLDIQGYPVIFYDTAGLRETECRIEKQGIVLAYQKMVDADLILYLQEPIINPDIALDISLHQNKTLNIFTKKDIYKENMYFKNKNVTPYFYISNVSRETINPIFDYIAAYFKFHYDKQQQTPLLNERYHFHISKILEQLKIAQLNLFLGEFFLFSEDLKIVQYEIEKMTCRIDTEELLDTIFSTFCIGK
jgi:tRNA modification GTPase